MNHLFLDIYAHQFWKTCRKCNLQFVCGALLVHNWGNTHLLWIFMPLSLMALLLKKAPVRCWYSHSYVTMKRECVMCVQVVGWLKCIWLILSYQIINSSFKRPHEKLLLLISFTLYMKARLIATVPTFLPPTCVEWDSTLMANDMSQPSSILWVSTVILIESCSIT